MHSLVSLSLSDWYVSIDLLSRHLFPALPPSLTLFDLLHARDCQSVCDCLVSALLRSSFLPHLQSCDVLFNGRTQDTPLHRIRSLASARPLIVNHLRSLDVCANENSAEFGESLDFILQIDFTSLAVLDIRLVEMHPLHVLTLLLANNAMPLLTEFVLRSHLNRGTIVPSKTLREHFDLSVLTSE